MSALAIVLFGIAFGAAAGQSETAELGFVFRQPGLHRLAVVHPKVVQDQVGLRAAASVQATQNIGQDVGVECAVKEIAAQLALVGDGEADRPAGSIAQRGELP